MRGWHGKILPGFFLLTVIGLLCANPSEDPGESADITIIADRPTPLRTGILNTAALRAAPQTSLDGVLRQVPGFSLFRRSDSLIAHPTAQGVSLGNTGPNGASRAAVLLDGVPMNDPFGGWIPWNRIPVSSLASVTLTPDGRPALPSAGPLFATVALRSRFLVAAPFASVEAVAGDRLAHQGAFAFAQDSNQGRTRIFGGVQEIDFRGYKVIRKDLLGPVDINAFSRSQGFDTGIRQFMDSEGDWTLTLRTRGWQEQRGNGTPLAQNRSKALDFSLQLEHRGTLEEWSGQWTAFHQRNDFASTFTSISANRLSEILTLDQYAVPSTSTGLLQKLRFPALGNHVLSLGTDLRIAEGATHENFRNLGVGFTRGREAGGNQTDAGVSLEDRWTVFPQFVLTPSARVGLHFEQEGRLREWDLSSGSAITNKTYPARQTAPVDLRLAAHWKPRTSLEAEAAVFSSHRQPTLNELYRPYQLGNTLTLANPDLRSETLLGSEAGLLWHPNARLTLKTRVFFNELRDAVANVSEVVGPGSFPDWGVLRAGVIGARRENLDAIRIFGCEAGADATLPFGMKLETRWLHSTARIRRAAVQRSLEGLIPAQMPSDVASLTLKGEWPKWRWQLGASFATGQFDDDQNQRRLAGYASFNALVTRELGKGCEWFLGVENLANKEIQTRRDPDGTISITNPRSWKTGVRWEF